LKAKLTKGGDAMPKAKKPVPKPKPKPKKKGKWDY